MSHNAKSLGKAAQHVKALGSGDTVNDHRYLRARQGESRQKLAEFLPAHESAFPASVEPIKQQQSNFVGESMYALRVIRHPVVSDMSPQLRGSYLHSLERGSYFLIKSLLIGVPFFSVPQRRLVKIDFFSSRQYEEVQQVPPVNE
jgi:hypothetical protein